MHKLISNTRKHTHGRLYSLLRRRRTMWMHKHECIYTCSMTQPPTSASTQQNTRIYIECMRAFPITTVCVRYKVTTIYLRPRMSLQLESPSISVPTSIVQRVPKIARVLPPQWNSERVFLCMCNSSILQKSVHRIFPKRKLKSDCIKSCRQQNENH